MAKVTHVEALRQLTLWVQMFGRNATIHGDGIQTIAHNDGDLLIDTYVVDVEFSSLSSAVGAMKTVGDRSDELADDFGLSRWDSVIILHGQKELNLTDTVLVQFSLI